MDLFDLCFSIFSSYKKKKEEKLKKEIVDLAIKLKDKSIKDFIYYAFFIPNARFIIDNRKRRKNFYELIKPPIDQQKIAEKRTEFVQKLHKFSSDFSTFILDSLESSPHLNYEKAKKKEITERLTEYLNAYNVKDNYINGDKVFNKIKKGYKTTISTLKEDFEENVIKKKIKSFPQFETEINEFIDDYIKKNDFKNNYKKIKFKDYNDLTEEIFKELEKHFLKDNKSDALHYEKVFNPAYYTFIENIFDLRIFKEIKERHYIEKDDEYIWKD